MIMNSRGGTLGWRKDGHPGKQLNGLMDDWKGTGRDGLGDRDPQIIVHTQTDCEKRTGLRQTEGQINRRTDSAKANKQRQTVL